MQIDASRLLSQKHMDVSTSVTIVGTEADRRPIAMCYIDTTFTK